MKLNLVPSHVKDAQGVVVFMVIGLLLALGGVGASMYLMNEGQAELDAANDRIRDELPAVNRAMGKSAMADVIIQQAEGIDRNIKLANAMLEHSAKYPELFRDVMAHIPSFYRITSLSATPTSAMDCTVTMTGVLQTSQQYADLVAALYRMPGVTSVARGGFVSTDNIVPTLNELDQYGAAVAPGDPNLPSNWEDQMTAQSQRAAAEPTGFLNVEGFGSADADMKGAMPGWSVVTITMSISRPMQTPDPRATVNQHGAFGDTDGLGSNLPGFGAPR